MKKSRSLPEKLSQLGSDKNEEPSPSPPVVPSITEKALHAVRKGHSLSVKKMKEEKKELEEKHIEVKETLQTFKEKDHQRTEHFARLGSPSSQHIVVERKKCYDTFLRVVNYLLERGEEERRQDSLIQRKSYAGFYYFIKWFVRTLFLTAFTVAGNIGGKEIGCAIKDHEVCGDSAFNLWEGSPHLIASICGSIVGLVSGQWLARLIWDHSVKCIRHCLRKCEKKADQTKLYLFVVTTFIYIAITGSFSIMFRLLVPVDDNENINTVVGGVIGAVVGLLLAVLAYRKTSPCVSGEEETPHIKPQNSIIDPPTLVININPSSPFRNSTSSSVINEEVLRTSEFGGRSPPY